MNKVILNIGHGFNIKNGKKIEDPGAIGNGFKEHEWNKDFVNNYVAKECEKAGIKYEIVIQDDFSTLAKKINNIATKNDICLSFHLNSFKEESGNGVEMYYWHTAKTSQNIANDLLNANLTVTKLKNRGIKPMIDGMRGSALLKGTICPCVLLENGFISNKNNIEVLNNKKSELAKAIVEVIKKYVSHNEGTTETENKKIYKVVDENNNIVTEFEVEFKI